MNNLIYILYNKRGVHQNDYCALAYNLDTCPFSWFLGHFALYSFSFFWSVTTATCSIACVVCYIVLARGLLYHCLSLGVFRFPSLNWKKKHWREKRLELENGACGSVRNCCCYCCSLLLGWFWIQLGLLLLCFCAFVSLSGGGSVVLQKTPFLFCIKALLFSSFFGSARSPTKKTPVGRTFFC